MGHLVDVIQLRSLTGKSFLNVEGEYGHIGVNTFAALPTLLMTRKHEVYLFVQFDNEEELERWLEDNSQYEIVMRLDQS